MEPKNGVRLRVVDFFRVVSFMKALLCKPLGFLCYGQL